MTIIILLAPEVAHPATCEWRNVVAVATTGCLLAVISDGFMGSDLFLMTTEVQRQQSKPYLLQCDPRITGTRLELPVCMLVQARIE